MEKFAAEVFDIFRKILHPKNPQPDGFIQKIKTHMTPGTKFVTAVGGAFKYEPCFAQLKSKFLLKPQQKDKKNVQMCVQIGANSFLAIQTGLVLMGGKDIPYSHCFAASKQEGGVKVAVNFFCTQNAKERTPAEGMDKFLQEMATKYLGFVQQKKMRELAVLFNPNIRGNFIKDGEAYAGPMANHVKIACNSNLMFGPWMKSNARFLAVAGLGGAFSVTTGLCCIGEDNKDRPVAFTHLFWMNQTKKICVDVFRLNLG
jgi:hypothetical protein